MNRCVPIYTEVAAYTDRDLRDLTMTLGRFNETFKFLRTNAAEFNLSFPYAYMPKCAKVTLIG